jgi:hypothetical protein
VTIFLAILCLILTGFSAFSVWAFFRLLKRQNDMENFVVGLYKILVNFKQAIDFITKSNILVYDESAFEVMRNCQRVKKEIDQYFTKYDEYGKYIFTEDIEKTEEPKEVLGIIKKTGNNIKTTTIL